MSAEQEVPGAEDARPDGWFEAVLMAIVGTTIFLMMVITFVDVVGRYGFNLPIPGGFELIEFLMPLSIFAGMPIITRRRAHIVVSVFDRWFAGRAGEIRRLVVDAGCLAVVAFIAERLWRQGQSLAEARMESGYLEWPIAPAAYGISILCVVTVVVLAIMVVRDVRVLFGGGAPAEGGGT